MQSYQTLQDPLAPIVPPYHRVPQLDIAATRNDIGGLLDLALPAQYTYFTHETLVEGERTSMDPTIRMPLLAPGYFITPKAGVHLARYRSTTPTRASRSTRR